MRNAKGWERTALPSSSGAGKKGTGGVHSSMWDHPSTWWFRHGEEGTGVVTLTHWMAMAGGVTLARDHPTVRPQ